MYCSVCRDLKPADCPGCADNGNDNNIPPEEIMTEMFRDVGETWCQGAPADLNSDYNCDYEYYPGCYEG